MYYEQTAGQRNTPETDQRLGPLFVTVSLSIVIADEKMSEIAGVELTHPVVVASSAGTLRWFVKHIAAGCKPAQRLSAPSRTAWLETALFTAMAVNCSGS